MARLKREGFCIHLSSTLYVRAKSPATLRATFRNSDILSYATVKHWLRQKVEFGPLQREAAFGLSTSRSQFILPLQYFEPNLQRLQYNKVHSLAISFISSTCFLKLLCVRFVTEYRGQISACTMSLNNGQTSTGNGLFSPKIGVIVGSQRSPRVGLQIATFVLNLLQKHQATRSKPITSGPPVSSTLSLIDIAEYSLPLFNEPGIPREIYSPSEYAHEKTQAWSKLISSYSAFIFVTPEYNRGLPASLKNAIDYLYQEWSGKPAMIVSYGTFGGVTAARHLRDVLNAPGMKIVERTVNMAFPSKQTLVKAMNGEDFREELSLNDTPMNNDDGTTKQKLIWCEERRMIISAFEELLVLLHTNNC